MLYFPRHRLRPELTPSQHAFFHVVSRVVDRQYIFGHAQKEKFLEYMRLYEKFCQIRVVGYCLMDDHFHLIVEVPGRPTERPSQQALLNHVKETLGQTIHDQYQDRFEFWSQQLKIGQERCVGNDSASESPLDSILPSKDDLAAYAAAQLEKVSKDIWRRMYDVSQFIFSLKQQFSHWYNKQSNRVGTLWEERFRATLLQAGPAVAEVVAYVDLNPVRAGIVRDAREYPWSQYGAAIAGDLAAQNAITYLAQQPSWFPEPHSPDLEEGHSVSGRLLGPVARLEMPLLLMHLLLERRGLRESEDARRDEQSGYRFAQKSADTVSYVTGPIRSFVRGLAIGDSAFLESVFESNRDQFGPRRRTGAKAIRFFKAEVNEIEANANAGGQSSGNVAEMEEVSRSSRARKRSLFGRLPGVKSLRAVDPKHRPKKGVNA